MKTKETGRTIKLKHIGVTNRKKKIARSKSFLHKKTKNKISLKFEFYTPGGGGVIAPVENH